MVYLDFLNNVREKIANGINTFFEEEYELQPVRNFVLNRFDVFKAPYSMAIYADSSDSGIFTQDDNALYGKIVVEFYLNDSADSVSVNLLESYFSAIAEYLSKQTFGEHSVVADSIVVRTDNQDPCNEALFLLSCRIQKTTDDYFNI